MDHNLVSFLDLLNNVQWRTLVKKNKNKTQQLISWLENKSINNISVAAKYSYC